MVLKKPKITIGGDSKPSNEQLEILSAELNAPVWGMYRKGLLEKMRFPTKPSAYAVGIWMTLLSGFQVSVPLNLEESYTSNEFDSNGEARVVYNKIDTEIWSKTKKSCAQGLHVPDSELPVGGAPSPKLLSSSGEIVIEEKVIRSIKQEERISVALSSPGDLLGNTSLSIKYKNEPQIVATKEVPPLESLVLSASEPFVQVLPIDAMDKEKMKGLTFERTLNALVSKSRDPRKKALWASKNDEPSLVKDQKRAEKWTEDWARYFAALPAFFRQEPAALKRAEKEIREGKPATASLLGGLESSGNPEAQEVLIRLVRDDKLIIELRESALRNLVQCAHPTKISKLDCR